MLRVDKEDIERPRISEVTFKDILEHSSYHGKVIKYLWDFGVNLSHILIVKGRIEASKNIKCISGKGGSLRPSGRIRPFNDKNHVKINCRLAKIGILGDDEYQYFSVDCIDALL
jgi:hypothetical protein